MIPNKPIVDKNKNRSFSFSTYAWRQFKKNKPAYFSLYILIGLVIVAILAPIMANECPLYMRYNGESFFPAFSFKNKYHIKNTDDSEKEIIQLDIADWKMLNADVVIWAPVSYSPGKSDFLNSSYVSPLGEQRFRNKDGQVINMPSRFRHWLGTNIRGEDVLAGLIHGTRVSLSVGVLSMGIAAFLGLLLGSMAGYFGDDKLYTTRGRFWTFILGVIVAYFYAFISRSMILSDALALSGVNFLGALIVSILLVLLVLFVFSYIGKYVGRIPYLNQQVNIPVDSIISRLIEILISLPTFILIISIAAVAKPSIFNVMVIIGLTSWTGIARLTRAEFLRIRQLEYIQAAQAMGFTQLRIIVRHALKNGIAPSLVSIAFGIAAAILIESSLSFLGVGVPPDAVTWGALLSSGRSNFNAWWLVVFPGLAIFITVTVYNLIGEGLRDALDPRLKR